MTKQYPTTSSQLKKLFRKSFRETESPLPQLQIDNQSFSITKHLITLPEYLSSNSVSIFLSMQGEVNTSYILIDLFNRGKSVFIPKCDGKIMKMVELKSMHDFKTLPLNSWGIPEPLDNDIKTRTDC
jgi:5-formyltetrahydrofolate cyclo-ligase